MTLFRTAPPAAEPVTAAEVKAHLRLDHASEDALIGDLIRTAREEVEAATGCALIEQGWRLVMDGWPASGRVLLHRHPVRVLAAVTVYGQDGEPTVLDPDRILVDVNARPARLHVDRLPQPGQAMNGIEIDFTAGFGTAGAEVPDMLKRAIVLLAAHWFEFRAQIAPKDQPVSFPRGYERLIAPWRSRRL